MPRITTLLFDLDGTLLPMNMDYFVAQYMQKLASRFLPILEPKQFIACLWQATNAMITNTEPGCDNETAFWDCFTRLVPQPRTDLESLFDDFYSTEFKNLAYSTQPSPLAPQILDLAKQQGLKLVLATNPIFPAIATWERMRWAGIEDHTWELVTTYENSRFCKPNLNYYRDILDHLHLTPGECLMIGNDMQDDMVAAELGLATGLILDGLIDRGSPQYTPAFKGRLSDLKDYILKLND